MSRGRSLHSAHTHACQLIEHLQHGLQQAFPLEGRRAKRRHSFLSDATWDVHENVTRLRRACARCRLQESRHAPTAALAAWKGGVNGPPFAEHYYTPWLSKTLHAHAAFCRQLQLAGRALRSGCSNDRATYLSECARQVERGQGKEAALAVRRLLGHKRKKPFAPGVTKPFEG